jgi:predicted TIM-barrel fold metal-dependent hydrolase
LARLDDHYEWMHDTECTSLSMRPSDYFARQCAISSDPEDVLAPFVISRVGSDHVVWASDFPHPDAAYPDAVEEFTEKTEGVADADLRAVLWDTPLRFYRLDDRFST